MRYRARQLEKSNFEKNAFKVLRQVYSVNSPTQAAEINGHAKQCFRESAASGKRNTLWGWRQAEWTRARRSVGITEISGYIKEFGRKVHESEVSSAPE